MVGEKDLQDDDSQSSTTSSLNKRLKLDESERDLDSHDSFIRHTRQPVHTSIFVCPKTRMRKVIVIIPLLAGIVDAKFKLVGDGPGSSLARLEYSCPRLAVDIDALFAHDIASGELEPCHPIIESLKLDLENVRDNLGEYPKATMDIDLPIPVQTNSASIKKEGRSYDGGNNFLYVTLDAYQSLYVIKEEDQKVVFKDFQTRVEND